MFHPKCISTFIDNEKVIISSEDLETFNKYKWKVKRTKTNNYLVASIRKDGLTRSMLYHQLLLDSYGKGTSTVIDHIDGNGLNNCRENLRAVSGSQNNMNRRKLPDNIKKCTSRYKGVCKKSRCKDGKWEAHIKINRKQIYLGRFNSEILAAEAYNKAASQYFGEFALLNILEDI